MRADLQKLNINTTTDSHDTQDHRRGEDRSQETHRHMQRSYRRPESPTAIDYRSGERARITMRSQTKYARSQGTPSPQISAILGHFSYQPIIWHSGPRPRAHWYMCPDVANPRIVTLREWISFPQHQIPTSGTNALMLENPLDLILQSIPHQYRRRQLYLPSRIPSSGYSV